MGVKLLLMVKKSNGNSDIKIDEFSKKTRTKVESLLNFHMNLEKLPGLFS